MRRSHIYMIAMIAVMAAWAGPVGMAQRVNSVQEFTQGMKIIGASVSAANKAIGSSVYPDAKAQLVLARQMLASMVPFWREHKVDAAAEMAKSAVGRLDALDKALSAEPVDSAAAADAFKQVIAACAACHSAYREGDQQTGYRFKEGVITSR